MSNPVPTPANWFAFLFSSCLRLVCAIPKSLPVVGQCSWDDCMTGLLQSVEKRCRSTYCKLMLKLYKEWYSWQSRTRLTAFCSSCIGWAGFMGWLAYRLGRPTHHLILTEAIAFGIVEFSGLALIVALTLRWSKPKRNYH